VGAAWAALFARKYNVCLFDTDPARVEGGLKDAKTKLTTLEEANLIQQEPLETIFARISAASNLKDALKGAFYVQECIPEILDLKLSVWKELDQEADPSTILGSSTSNIPVSKFTENLSHRERCLVAHPVNPPHLIKLVEIVPSPWTDPEVVKKTRSLMEEIGQKPVVLNKEVNGFALNRLQYAVLGECFRMVQEGVLSPADVDTTLNCGLAPRWAIMGAFQTIDLNAPKGISFIINSPASPLTKFDLQKGLRIIAQDTWVD